MYRVKDFLLMEVLNCKGKKIGSIKDLYLNFNGRQVIGFNLSSNKIFGKEAMISLENILSFNEKMIVKEKSIKKGILFNSIKGMDIIDLNGDLIGLVSDILFKEKTFKIKGIIASTGIINDFKKGKKIILIEHLILGDKYITYFKREDKFSFESLPHKIFVKEDKDEFF